MATSSTNGTQKWTYQGISVDSGPLDIWQQGALKHAMDDVVAINANSVAIVARYTMDNGKSSTVYASDKTTESLENIEQAIQDAQARGLNVILKPHLTPADGTFSGVIAPANAAAWFASYKKELLDLARLAEANDVPLFSIGNELTSMIGSQYTGYWEDIIASVRQVYSGQLTMAAQYWNIDQIEFWDDLDIIGVNAYTVLTPEAVPSVEQAYNAWASQDSAFAAKHNGLSIVEYTAQLAEKWDKQVVITEMGFRSIEGAGAAPGDFASTGKYSEQAQAALYEGFLKAWGEAGDWFAGTFLWGWNVAKGQNNDYSPQDKLAFDIIADAFGGSGDKAQSAPLGGGASVITIRVSGKGPAGYTPEMLVTLDGVIVADYAVTAQMAKGEFVEYTIRTGTADPSRLQIFFDNPVPNSALYVDWVEVNGARYQAEGFGVDNNANPTIYKTAGIATLFTGGSLNFDLDHGVADGKYTVHKMNAAGVLNGTAGDDLIVVVGKSAVTAGTGNDIIDASGAEASLLDAGAGNDVILGSNGNDAITTGAGRDRIIVAENGGVDVVNDFDPAMDLLDFTRVKATTAALTIVEKTMGGVTGTAVTFKSSTIFLAGVKPSDLSPENFAFTSTGLAGPTGQKTDMADEAPVEIIEKVTGTSGDDVLLAMAVADTFDGEAGIDTVSYEKATAFVRADLSGAVLGIGDAQGDTFANVENLIGSNYDDWLYGDAQDNVISGGKGNDNINGGAGKDTLYGGDGDDNLYASEGDDILIGGAGADLLNGGAGVNFASYAGASSGIRVDMRDSSRGTGDASGDKFVSIQGVIGTGYNDEIHGDYLANTLRGEEGNDVLFGRIGDDTLEGGGGDDILVGGVGADLLFGGAGFDYASYEDAVAFVRADLSGAQKGLGDANGDRFDSIEGLIGSRFDDWLYGNSGDNVIYGGDGKDNLAGGAGHDTLYGGAGNDQLFGSEGDDVLEGGAGADVLNGGAGFNTASYAGANAGVTADIANTAKNTGDASGDSYISILGLRGSAFADKLYGNATANTIWGGDGDDYIDGGKGNDTLVGGRGNDTLVGGEGRDVFEFSESFGNDVVKDFSRAQGDVLRLGLGPDYDTFEEILSAMTKSGNDALFDFGNGNTIVLEGQANYQFQADDFSLF